MDRAPEEVSVRMALVAESILLTLALVASGARAGLQAVPPYPRPVPVDRVLPAALATDKPATNGGKLVRVWVAIPVKFALH